MEDETSLRARQSLAEDDLVETDEHSSDLASSLLEARALFERAFDKSDIGFLVLDTSHQIVRANAAAGKIFGFNVSDASGLSFETLIHSQELDADRRSRNKALKAGRFTRREERRCLKTNGSIIWCAVSYASAPEYGDEQLVYAQVEDISALKRVEDSLRLSKEQFRRSFHDAGVGMAMTDLDGSFIEVNREYAKFLGYRRSQLVGVSPFDLHHPEDRDDNIRRRKEVLQGKPRLKGREVRYLHRDGHYVWGQASLAVVRDEDGKPVHTIGFIRDITKLKEAEIALRASEERFRRIFMDAGIGMLMADIGGNIVLANRALARMLGRTLSEMTSLNLSQILHPDFRSRSLEQRQAAIEGGSRRSHASETKLLRKDGSSIWVDLTRAVVKGGEGEPAFTVGQFQDISERKAAEELLRSHNKILAEVAGDLDLDKVLAKVALSVETACPNSKCAVTLVSEDATSLKLAAAPSLPKYLTKKLTSIPATSKSICAGAAVRTQKMTVVTDVTSNVEFDFVARELKRAGIRACWSTPILSADETVLGAITICHGDNRRPNKAEKSALQTAGSIAGIAMDRERTERRLRERESRFRDYASAAADTFWETDRNHQFVFVSSIDAEKTGADRVPRIAGMTPWQWAEANLEDEEWSEVHRDMTHWRPFRNFHFSRTGADGQVRFYRVNGAPFYSSDGKPQGFRGTTIDETAEVEARRREKDTQRKFLDAMENVGEGFILWDGDDQFVTCNGHYRATHNVVADLLVPGTKFADYIRERGIRSGVSIENGDVDRWVEARIAAHSSEGNGDHETLIGGRWYRVRRQRLDDGSTIVFHSDITDTREREVRVRESEAKYRALFEHATDSIFLIDKETGYIVDANQKAAERLGYQRNELIGMRLFDISIEASPSSFSSLRRTMTRDGVTAMERVHKRKDGSLLDVEITSHVIEIDGRATIQSFVRDISNRKAAEIALRESEERFRDFASTAADRFWETDEQHRFTFVSDRPVDSVFLPPEEFIGMQRWEMVGVDAEASFWDEQRMLMDSQKAFRDHQFTVQNSRGEPRTIRISGKPIFSEDGTFKGYRGSTVDVTAEVNERKRTAGIQDRFFDAMENITEGVILWDPDDRMVMCNSYYREMNERVAEMLKPGISYRSLMTKIAEDGVYPEAIGREAAFVEEAIESHRLPSSELERLVDGKWIRVREQRLGDGSTLAFHQDVTEAKIREEALRQAQKMEAVGQLTGGIAHDFNNLLAAILGNLEILSNNLSGDPVNSDRARRAMNSVMRGSQLTSRLLAFSRKQTLEPRSTDLNAMLIGMLDLLQRSLGETINIHMRPATGLWLTLVDQPQLENAVLNLAINARDAMPDGGELTFETSKVVLEESFIATHPYAKPGEFVALRVRDTGAGIPTNVMEHVFEPFFTTKGVGEGSGLGLSMVFGFVKQSGGYIDVESEPGEGTTVSIYLPRVADQVEDGQEQEEPERLSTGHGETILVIEDNEDVLDVALTMLKDLGYSPISATDADEAFSVIDSGRGIALVLSDVVLPGGSGGLEIAQRLATRNPEIKLLLMSGFAEGQMGSSPRDGSTTDSTNHYPMIKKPFSYKELSEEVAALLYSEEDK